jgi:hypothetical protein
MAILLELDAGSLLIHKEAASHELRTSRHSFEKSFLYQTILTKDFLARNSQLTTQSSSLIAIFAA